jgi:hypothetical protein
MSADERGAMTDVPVGLCDGCRHAREIRSDRGARFVLCERSRDDPRYPRYPRLPVLACPGFEALPPAPESTTA